MHRSRTRPDQTGLDRRPKWGQVLDRGPDRSLTGVGPRTEPVLDQSWTGPDRKMPEPVQDRPSPAQLARCARGLARSGRAPSVFRARAARAERHDRAASLRKKIKKKLCKIGPLVRSVGPPVQPGTEPKDRIPKFYGPKIGPKIGPKRTGPVRSEPVLGPVQSWTESYTPLPSMKFWQS